MKLDHLTISNFIGARAVDVPLTNPVTLFTGRNYAGKSSVQEAVRMALTGESVRVSLKKDYADLVSEGQDTGFAEVGVGNNAYSIVLPSGKGHHCDIAALPFVLDAQRFASLDANARRSFLFGLMDIKLDGPSVTQRLLDRRCNARKVEQIAPLLRAGFDAAAKEAGNKAREAKAGWKAVTGGETWGKDKSANWKPAPLPADSDKAASMMENAKARLLEADQTLGEAQATLGAAEAEQRRISKEAAERDTLAEHAGKLERIQTKLNLDTDEMTAWEKKVADTREKAGTAPASPMGNDQPLLRALASVTSDFLELTCNRPEVEWEPGLINRAAIHLADYKKLHGEPVEIRNGDGVTPDPEAVAKLPEYENALALLKRSVENGKRDLEAAQKAAARLVELDNQTQAGIDMETPRAKVAELTEKRNAWRSDLDKYRAIAEQHKRQQEVIDQAAKLHADVTEWIDIADALSPDGIPGELLTEALEPINARLSGSANRAEWTRINIGADMSIFAAEEGAQPRSYALLSESEKWRSDAMIAEAVSHLSGVKLLVLDRFDVLDLAGREDALYWLDGLALDGEIDTALLFGTLKSLPAKLPETICAHWIENGVVGTMKAAA